jgi:hypothetical protein
LTNDLYCVGLGGWDVKAAMIYIFGQYSLEILAAGPSKNMENIHGSDNEFS